MIEVTFRRYHSGREHRARFDLGSDAENARCIVEHAWNTQSEVVSPTELPAPTRSEEASHE